MVSTKKPPTWQQTAKRLFADFFRDSKAAKRRTIREFAEAEIVTPTGRFKDFLFSCSRQPHTGLWFDQIDSGLWRRHMLTGPVQSGKSLVGFVIPAMYHLFEHGESVILGIPGMEMANDKWRKDIEPVIRASRYRDLIPTRGPGSRGGRFEAIQFRNGAELKFMSGGGGDEKRSGYTSRVLIVTEVDKMDTAGANSRETDPLRQLEARTASFEEKAVIYFEGTVSIEKGRIWQEYQKGSCSRIALHCPHCSHWVTPEREHLIGHQGAENEVEASQRTAWYCPDCGQKWTDADRLQANRQAVLVHRGQEVDEHGAVIGPPPPTFTLGFRYSSVNNFFTSPGYLGAMEWNASRAVDEDSAERELCQFRFSIPPRSDSSPNIQLDARIIAARMAHPTRGFLPHHATFVTVGIDIRMYQLHWSAIAWSDCARGHVIDYGVEALPTDQLGVELAILTGLRDLRGHLDNGWDAGPKGRITPRYVFVDSGYETETVYRFIRETQGPYHATKGQGTEQRTEQRGGSYVRPRTMSENILFVGDGMHIAWQPTKDIRLVELDSDHWKTWLHERWRCPLGGSGSMTLWQDATENAHYAFAKHQVAEEKQREFKAGKGEIVKWVQKKRQNHWLDTMSMACAAGFLAGVRLETTSVATEAGPPEPEPEPLPVLTEENPMFEAMRERIRDWHS